uniref:Uncharacterized protein n=1 Tax=Romanomermis culicivorax TaxID=13658 RepID=A0A915KJE0_ROMCU
MTSEMKMTMLHDTLSLAASLLSLLLTYKKSFNKQDQYIMYQKKQHQQDDRLQCQRGPQDPLAGPMVQRNFWVPVLVEIGKTSQELEFIPEMPIFRRHPVCGFDVEKIGQNKVAALLKMREVHNPIGQPFAHYISLLLANSQTYIIDMTGLMDQEWANHDQFAKRAILLEEQRLRDFDAWIAIGDDGRCQSNGLPYGVCTT